MTDYVKSTAFASKDSLPLGDPLKIVKGTEIDTEFNNIATAIATKADLNSPTFIGTPAAPTASPGTNTTQLATTAFIATAIAAAKEALYPVGSIYINAASATNPATLLGFGTWAEFGAGRVLVGQNASDALFDTLEETGGSKDAIVVSHTHTFSASGSTGGQSANHSHTFSGTTSGQSNSHQHLTGNNFEGGTPWGGPTTRYGFQDGWSVNRTANGSGTGYDTYTSNALSDHTHTYSGTTSGTSGDHTHSVSVSGTTASSGSSGTNANVQPYIVVKMWKRTA